MKKILFVILLSATASFAGSNWYVVKLSHPRQPVAGPFTFSDDCRQVAEVLEKQTGWMHSCRMLED